MNAILRYVIIIVLSIAVPTHAQPREKPDIDDTSRFIFYGVLEGLYEDGLSNKDVDQILMKKEKQTYFHFIYACPVCGATIWALEAYRGRPERLYGLKREGSTFGNGLSPELHEQLYSDDPQKRLIAINTLVKTWMERRMKAMNLSVKDRAALLEALEKKRKQGMEALESFRKFQHGPNFGVAEAAPAYVDLQECAVCNGAVGKPMKLPEPKPK
jgi:hypothetical protein